MANPDSVDGWVDVEIGNIVDYTCNLKPLRLLKPFLKPVLRLFGGWLLKPVLLHFKAMCSNCHTRFYCLGYMLEAAGITGPMILERYEKGMKYCKKMREDSFQLEIGDVYKDEIEQPLLDGNPVAIRAKLNKPYLLYVEPCLKCTNMRCPVWSLKGVRVDKTLDGLYNVINNCNHIRHGGMKGRVVIDA